MILCFWNYPDGWTIFNGNVLGIWKGDLQIHKRSFWRLSSTFPDFPCSWLRGESCLPLNSRRSFFWALKYLQTEIQGKKHFCERKYWKVLANRCRPWIKEKCYDMARIDGSNVEENDQIPDENSPFVFVPGVFKDFEFVGDWISG